MRIIISFLIPGRYFNIPPGDNSVEKITTVFCVPVLTGGCDFKKNFLSTPVGETPTIAVAPTTGWLVN